MFRKRILQFCAAALGVVSVASLSAAQLPLGGGIPAPSGAPGYAGSALNSIYRQGVGEGYTAESLNQIALRNAQGSLGTSNVTARRPSAPSSLGLSSGPVSKPFSTYSPSPTVSPYLNLFREDFEGNSDLNYQTLVRPMLQQQRFNEQVQRQSMEIARRLQTIAAQPDFNPQGSQSQYPTGHKTVFNYLGHFYPTPARQRR